MVLLFSSVKNLWFIYAIGKFKQNLNIGKILDLNFRLHLILVFRVDKAFARGKGMLGKYENQLLCRQFVQNFYNLVNHFVRFIFLLSSMLKTYQKKCCFPHAIQVFSTSSHQKLILFHYISKLGDLTLYIPICF